MSRYRVVPVAWYSRMAPMIFGIWVLAWKPDSWSCPAASGFSICAWSKRCAAVRWSGLPLIWYRLVSTSGMPPNSVRSTTFCICVLLSVSVRALTQAAMFVSTVSAWPLPPAGTGPSRPAMILWIV